MKKVFVFLFFISVWMGVQAQPTNIDNPRKDNEVYDRKAEVIFEHKRYRVWNNYVTAGTGVAFSPQRFDVQRLGGGDFNFHLRDQYFQVGGFISGTSLAYAKNNLQIHAGYGKRIEKSKYNFALFAGPSFSYGFLLIKDTASTTGLSPQDYKEIGGYLSTQLVYKLKYDLGIGIELFADYNRKHQLFGGKIILFFSGAYRGYMPGYRPKKPFSVNE
ncbi:MAG: hypothetical protein QM534_15735 [Sediminibacterium sp.]|nr:hypothetical protein [Sediminibacterium sp.]